MNIQFEHCGHHDAGECRNMLTPSVPLPALLKFLHFLDAGTGKGFRRRQVPAARKGGDTELSDVP